jgi:hypothetical protein
MNSGLPGCPRKRGPPRHAYQYFFVEPSANVTTDQLMPLALMRMFCQPVFGFVAVQLLVCLVSDHDDLAVLVDLDACHLDARLGDRPNRSRHVALAKGLRTSTHDDTRHWDSMAVPTYPFFRGLGLCLFSRDILPR